MSYFMSEIYRNNEMSLAKTRKLEDADKTSYSKRVPNCQKCAQHGCKTKLKGHKRLCPFRDCNCSKCEVVSERQKLMADQIKNRRRQRKEVLKTSKRDYTRSFKADQLMTFSEKPVHSHIQIQTGGVIPTATHYAPLLFMRRVNLDQANEPEMLAPLLPGIPMSQLPSFLPEMTSKVSFSNPLGNPSEQNPDTLKFLVESKSEQSVSPGLPSMFFSPPQMPLQHMDVWLMAARTGSSPNKSQVTLPLLQSTALFPITTELLQLLETLKMLEKGIK